MMKNIFCMSLLIVASSCSLMSLDDCKNANWRHYGEKDAREGLERSHFYQYEKCCRKHGVVANGQEYNQGYLIGLEFYCTYENGYKVGKEGKTNPGICPASSRKDFSQGYFAGNAFYEQKKYYEQQLELQKAEAERNAVMREKAIGNMSQKSCTSSSDCVIRDSCQMHQYKCSATGKKCTFDSDCEIRGTCSGNRCHYY